MKKSKFVGIIIAATLMITSCSTAGTNSGTSGNNSIETWTVQNSFTYEDISKWQSMKTPNEGSGSGSVVETNTSDGFVTIKAADDGWGGLESDYIEIDLDKDPYIFAKVFENPDGFKWGLKIVPENAIEDHAWGLYLIQDNNLKWNKYAGTDLKSVLDDDFKAIYGNKFKAKIWVYAAGGPEATVSVSEMKLLNTK